MAEWALKSGRENISIDLQVESIDSKNNPNNASAGVIIQNCIYSEILFKQINMHLFLRACNAV